MEQVNKLFPMYARIGYPFLKRVAIGPLVKSRYDIKPEGLENIPSEGAAILAGNHISFVDSIFLPLVVPRRVTFLAKAEYWDSWKTAWFFSMAGQIPVRRDDSAKASRALDSGIEVLNNGGLLGIYPEGTRSPDGRLYKGKTGPARMASAAGVPIIPVGLVGTREVMPKESKLPRFSGKVSVRFGAPMTPPSTDDDPLALRSFTDELMFRIRELSGQEYVDAYADRKAKRPSGVEQVA